MALIQIKRDFQTRKEANAFRRSVLKTYHPLGYGTQITVRKREVSNGVVVFEVRGYRAGSAD